MSTTTKHHPLRGRAVAAVLVAFAVTSTATPPASVATAPASSASSAPSPLTPLPAVPSKKPPPAPVKRIDINTASRKELKTLPGIGDAEAARIIANRPYLTKTELVSNEVLGIGPYLSLKNRIVAMPNKQSEAKLQALVKAQQAQQAQQAQPR